jgi:hypothetical protein
LAGEREVGGVERELIEKRKEEEVRSSKGKREPWQREARAVGLRREEREKKERKRRECTRLILPDIDAGLED